MIRLWNPSHQLIGQFGTEGDQKGEFNSITDMAIGKNGVYVVDARNKRLQLIEGIELTENRNAIFVIIFLHFFKCLHDNKRVWYRDKVIVGTPYTTPFFTQVCVTDHAIGLCHRYCGHCGKREIPPLRVFICS